MKIFNQIELVDLAIYTNKTLVFADFHIGYEEALNKQGTLVPRFQFKEIMTRLDSIFNKLKVKKIERIIVNGDIKHEFGTISDQEWRYTLKLLDYFGRHCKEIILVKGNHDTVLGPIARKRNIKVREHYLISPIINNSFKKISNNKISLKNNNIINNNSMEKNSKNNNKIKINNKIEKLNENIGNKIIKSNEKNNILIIHGNKIPNKESLKNISTIIIGHEHPAVSIKEGPRAELFKAYIIGKWKSKKLIVQPSFNLVTEGTDILKEELLSPFLKQNLGNFDVVIVADKMYRFGKVRGLS